MFKDNAEPLFASETSIAKDLKMNLFNLSDQSSLSKEEFFTVLLGLAYAKKHKPLIELATAEIDALGSFSEEQKKEIQEAPAIMGMLNSYYKFRHFLKKSQPEKEGQYGPARLRMLSVSAPKLGKERFELLALGLSILNGCEQCVNAHEEALTKMNVSIEKLHDLARLTSVTIGITSLN